MLSSQDPTYSAIAQRLYELYITDAVAPGCLTASDDTFFSQFDLYGFGLTKFGQDQAIWQIVFVPDVEVEGNFIVDIHGDTAGMDTCITKAFLSDFEQDEGDPMQMDVNFRSLEACGFWLPSHFQVHLEWMAGREAARAQIWKETFLRGHQNAVGLPLLEDWAINDYRKAATPFEYSVHTSAIDHASFLDDKKGSVYSVAYVMGICYEVKLLELERSSDPLHLQLRVADPLSLRRTCFRTSSSLNDALKIFGPTGLFLRHRVLEQITDECHDEVNDELRSAFPIRP